MKRCLICGGKFKNGAGLASHRRSQHKGFKGENRIAAEETIATLDRDGRLKDEHAASLQIIRSLADQLDCDPSNAQMWRTYSEALALLVESDDGNDDPFKTLLDEINSRAPVGNAKKT